MVNAIITQLEKSVEFFSRRIISLDALAFILNVGSSTNSSSVFFL